MTSIDSKIEPKKLSHTTESNIPSKFNHLKRKVAVVQLDNYEPDMVKLALETIFNLLDLKNYIKNKSIILKPNALAPSKNAFTPPEILEELIKLIKSDAKEILVGDSTMTKKLTSITMKRARYVEKCEAVGARIINFFESKRNKIKLLNPQYASEEHLYLPKEICDSDIIINLPKLKTHNGYVYTGAIKNFFGLLGNKMNMHMTHKNKTKFQEMLADIYFAVEETNTSEIPKVLTIMDAVIAMEGKGPRSGDPRKIGLLIAGFNSAAVDIVGYTLMNGNPKDLDAINSLASRTELPVDITQLEIVGIDNYEDYIAKDFKKPSVIRLKRAQVQESGIFSKIKEKAMSISIKINKKKCILCETCVKHCPAEAMVRKNDKIIIDHDACVECFCCGESCPNDAISAKWWVFRQLPLLLVLFGIVGILGIFGIMTLIGYILSLF
jgi:uncharacterized protein (DUF362 family)/NAD-dependent dihydropyrimidine dehydrogenase PreA subunit